MRRMMLLVMVMFLAAGFLGCGGNRSGSGDGEGDKQSASTRSQENDAWQTVFQDSGEASTDLFDEASSTFHLGGGRKVARYTVDRVGEDLIMFYATLQSAGPGDYPGFPIGPVTSPGSGEVPVNAGEGDYFLRIQAKNCKWSLAIDESED